MTIVRPNAKNSAAEQRGGVVVRLPRFQRLLT